MSAGEAIGRSRTPAALPVDHEIALALDPATGALFVTNSGGGVAPVANPDNIIYSSAALEAFSLIPAAAAPASMTSIYAWWDDTSADSVYLQLHRNNAEPAAGAVPFIVPSDLTLPGDNVQFSFGSGGVERGTTGWVIVPSLDKNTYFAPAAPTFLRTRAFGQP